jgi:hypothetical protein
MARKGWTTLSDAYRKRLEKNGITKTDYERGVSLQGARGHSRTPERPSQTKNHPTYQLEQTQLITKIVDKQHFFFSTSPKFNPGRHIAMYKTNPPSIKLLRKWAKMTKDEWIDAIRETGDYAKYLGYH